MKNTVKLIIAAALLAAAGLPASAELKGKNEISVQIGGLMFEGDADIDTGLAYGARLGRFFTERVSAELMVFKSDTETEAGADVGALYPALAASYHFRFGDLMPFVQAGAGVLRLDPDGADASNDLAVHWGGGLKYFYKPDILVRADISHIIDTESGDGTHDLLAVVGASWLFGDSGAEEARAAAEDAARKAEEAARKAADEAKRKAEEAARKAAEEARQKAEEAAAKAAPIADSDGDGVTEDKDNCAGTPAGTKVGADGCPEAAGQIPADEWILKGVNFQVGSDILAEEGKTVLDDAAAILLPRKSVRIEVQGHTDSTGDAARNQELSEKRAMAVKEYLVAKGVDASRLETKGYGSSVPVGDNATAEGRAANRRIEFKVLSR